MDSIILNEFRTAVFVSGKKHWSGSENKNKRFLHDYTMPENDRESIERV